MSTVKELREAATEAIEALYSACERDVSALETKVTDLEGELQSEREDDCEDCKSYEKEIAVLEANQAVWGNCRRGCAPAYLKDGFCSPACAMGAPRGEFVTVGVSVGRTTSREPNVPTGR